jgi:hypothetical protein
MNTLVFEDPENSFFKKEKKSKRVEKHHILLEAI